MVLQFAPPIKKKGQDRLVFVPIWALKKDEIETVPRRCVTQFNFGSNKNVCGRNRVPLTINILGYATRAI